MSKRAAADWEGRLVLKLIPPKFLAMPILLRHATAKDIPTLQRWDEKQHNIEAYGQDDGDFDWVTEIPRDVDRRELLIAEDSGQPIGFVQIIDPLREETHYWGEVSPNLRAIDIWIGEETNLGRGLGTQMMTQALARCFADSDVTAVLIDPLKSNERAIGFYKKMGFLPVEDRIFEVEICLVMRIDRSRWEMIQGITHSA